MLGGASGSRSWSLLLEGDGSFNANGVSPSLCNHDCLFDAMCRPNGFLHRESHFKLLEVYFKLLLEVPPSIDRQHWRWRLVFEMYLLVRLICPVLIKKKDTSYIAKRQMNLFRNLCRLMNVMSSQNYCTNMYHGSLLKHTPVHQRFTRWLVTPYMYLLVGPSKELPRVRVNHYHR